MNTPDIIQGGQHSDARGTLSFVNGFAFKGVDRFYWVKADRAHIARGWVGHKRERKWFTVVSGEVVIAAVHPDNWAEPSRNLPVMRWVLSGVNPQVLHVPPGHATASVSLTSEAILVIFSSGKLEDASNDDFRFPSDYWPLG